MFKIIPFKGEFAGKKYPDAYTRQEKILIEWLSADSQDEHLNDLNQRWYDWNVKREKEKRDKKGSLCRMGQMYAKILPDGRVVRCCALDKNGLPLGLLGRITDLDLRLLDEPTACEAENCPCFKSMLVGYEEEKWLPLWEGAGHPVYKIEDAKKFAESKAAQTQANTEIKIISQDKKEMNPVVEAKSDRRLINPHRVFVTWDIHYACNYRCEYCFFCKKWDEVAKENRYPGLDAWKRIWDDIYTRYGSVHIHVSGGEPFTYPDFIELVTYLTNNHTIEFDTNLSFDVDDFISKVSPGKVKFATAFHPTFANFKAYFEKVMKLKKAGFDIGINYVAYLKQLSQMKEYKKAFDKEHVSFTIMPFRGEFEGRTYPRGYTDEEKALIIECDSNLIISSKMIEWYGKDKLQRRGTVCRMGQMYTKIHPNGEAFRCCFINDKGKLGNLIDGTFALWEEPKLCEYPECPCWTAMVIGVEEQWQGHWVIPKIPQTLTEAKFIDMELE
jgi:MoaA/NifB/PqqE/SkfB family radical SAM enzyme